MSGRIAEIAGKLIPMEVERLLGWEGPPGAAYNCISEDLCSIGLLNRDWSLSELGQQVAAYLKEKNGG
jgi:hypothetical protein